jgi:hypothetical protein
MFATRHARAHPVDVGTRRPDRAQGGSPPRRCCRSRLRPTVPAIRRTAIERLPGSGSRASWRHQGRVSPTYSIPPRKAPRRPMPSITRAIQQGAAESGRSPTNRGAGAAQRQSVVEAWDRLRVTPVPPPGWSWTSDRVVAVAADWLNRPPANDGRAPPESTAEIGSTPAALVAAPIEADDPPQPGRAIACPSTDEPLDFVIPAKARIHGRKFVAPDMDARFRGHDEERTGAAEDFIGDSVAKPGNRPSAGRLCEVTSRPRRLQASELRQASPPFNRLRLLPRPRDPAGPCQPCAATPPGMAVNRSRTRRRTGGWGAFSPPPIQCRPEERRINPPARAPDPGGARDSAGTPLRLGDRRPHPPARAPDPGGGRDGSWDRACRCRRTEGLPGAPAADRPRPTRPPNSSN